MKFLLVIAAYLLLLSPILAVDKKNIEALRIDKPLTIDGILDEASYLKAMPAGDFVQLQPYNGNPSIQPSQAWIFYDENAIFVGGMLYDSSPDSIFNFLTERDDTGISDYFGVCLDPYNQGQLSYGFYVTSAGVQQDVKTVKSSYGDMEDSSWDAVWESKTRLTDKGWCFEMRIPYSALRFSGKNVGDWGLNMFRNIRRYNSNNSWNFIDRTTSGYIQQEGRLSGLKNIKPPVRLSLSPYLATYLERSNSGLSSMYKGGLDLKYGINESFTLDMMLIPDFGQVQSDDQKLNLSPFELYYSEKRQFFTEGTELFNRASVFYSRRIGSAPKKSPYGFLFEHEIVTSSPNETQLVNATKVSGRTNSGWGVGVLNAMSLPAFSTLKDTITQQERRVQLQPFTNYNVAVVDKTLKNNSFVSLVNTNVTMLGNPFRANVTATEFVLRNKQQTWALSGKGGVSLRGDSSLQSGFSGSLSLDKLKGRFKYGISQSFSDNTYNPNDLGFMKRNNELNTEVSSQYQIVEPFSIFREMSCYTWVDYTRMYEPWAYSNLQSGFFLMMTLKNNYRLNWRGSIQNVSHDYYETRTPGRYLLTPASFQQHFGLRSDWREEVSASIDFGGNKRINSDEFGFDVDLNMGWRIGQHLDLNLNTSFSNQINDRGFYTKVTDDIIFAKRNVRTVSNVVGATYAINNKTSMNLRMRHYWSSAQNKNYEVLQWDGKLRMTPSFTGSDQNYNDLTFDAFFRWVFAPGSEMSVVWKNNGDSFQNNVVDNYFDNLKMCLENQTNSLSLKVLYYIDFNTLKNRLKG